MSKLNIQLETNIDVIEKYNELVSASLGADSVYVRAKETMQELFDDSAFDNKEKGEIVSNVIANITGSITANSMNTALQWAAREKDLFLTKAEAEYRLALVDAQGDKAEVDTEISEAQKIGTQAANLRNYGTATLDADGDVASLSDDGLLFQQIESAKQDVVNKGHQADQIQAQTSSALANTHRTVADTYVNHGVFNGYTLAESGLTNVSKVDTGFTTLSDLNKQVAKEQAKGYTLNAWSNANTSSASMIGTLIAAEIPDLDVTPYLESWRTTNDNLSEVTLPAITI